MSDRARKARDRIIQGASSRFLAHGFSRVTMDRLAADLGVSKKTLYQHFASKEQLLYAVVTRFLEGNAAEVGAILGRRDDDVLAKLAALMDFMSRRLSEVDLVFFEELERYAPEMWQEVQEFRRRRITENFVKLYRAGRRQGLFSNDLDPQLTAQLFLAAVQGAMTPRSLSRLHFSPSQVLRSIIAIFLYGTVNDAARRGRKHVTPEVHS